MKVSVDFNRCVSSGTCADIAPQVFEVRDDGFLYVLQEEPPESLRAEVEEAEISCPTNAITLEG